MGTLTLEEQAAPSTPSSGKVVVYPKTDGRMYSKDDTGSETSMGGGGTLGTEQATTSGTSIDFTSIPSWVKKISVNLVGVSTNGTSKLILQIGDSGGVEPTGYSGAAVFADGNQSATNHNTGFIIEEGANAAAVRHGTVVLTLQDSSDNTWAMMGIISRTDVAVVTVASGTKSLSATLDRVRLTAVNGTDAFDAGSVNILYE